MTFQGWPVEAIEFFERLEDDNTKAFWTEHKPVYDECVKAPMEALLAELEPKFGAGKIFRAHRDVRFSKNKTPYKTNIGATFEKGGYVSLSADEFAVGNGYYMMAKDQLAKYRAAVVDDKTGKALERIIAKLAAEGIDIRSNESLKTAPRGFDKEHPRIERLRMKGCFAWQSHEIGAWLDSPKPKDRVIDCLTVAKPLTKWLDTNVGPSELAGRWG